MAVKWIKYNKSPYDKFDKYKAKYKDYKIYISGASNGWGSKVDYYYFLTENIKEDKTHNSLWNEGKYDVLEDAQTASVKWIDDILKEK